VDPWNESSTADVAYGDAYSGGYGDDGGHDPYNFKIKDPKKERKKKERKQRERERKRAKAKPQATRLSIEERTELRLKELRAKRETKLQEMAGPPPETANTFQVEDDDDDGAAAPGPEEDEDEAPESLAGTAEGLAQEAQHQFLNESNASSDLSESDFIPGAYAKKRDAEKKRAKEAGPAVTTIPTAKLSDSPDHKKGPVFDIKRGAGADRDELGGTGNVRIGSVDSPMLALQKKKQQQQERRAGAGSGSTFSGMADAFREPVAVSPVASPQRGGAGPETGPAVDAAPERFCAEKDCTAPEYMIQGNGKCHDCNNKANLLSLTSPPPAMNAHASTSSSGALSASRNNNEQETDEAHRAARDRSAESDKARAMLRASLEETQHKVLDAEKRALQASMDASEALKLARAAEERASAMEAEYSKHRTSAEGAQKDEARMKEEIEARLKEDMDRRYKIEMEAKYAAEAAAKAKAEKEAFERLQREALEAASKEAGGNDASFNTKLNGIAETAKEQAAQRFETVTNLRESHELVPPPPAKAANAFATGILGRVPRGPVRAPRAPEREASPGPPPPPTAAQAEAQPPRPVGSAEPSPNRFGFVGRARTVKYSNEGQKLAWEIREARLEEELDQSQQMNEGLRSTVTRLEKELSKAKESVAHHRQKAVEARLELQEMKGASSLRASRLRRLAETEEEKKKEERAPFSTKKQAEAAAGEGGARKRFDGPSEDELLRLEKELETMEGLIAGYQKENERLVEESKDSKLFFEDSKRRFFEDNERLNKTIINLKQQIAAPEDDYLNKANERLQKTLLRDQQIAKLEEDLGELRHKSKNKEEELKLQLAMAKKQAQDLEADMRIQMNATEQTEQQKVKDLKKKMTLQEGRYEESLGTLKKRLAWYAENQTIIDKNDELVKNQQQQISTLKKRLLQLEEVARVVARRGGTTPSRKKGARADPSSAEGGASPLRVSGVGPLGVVRRDPADIKAIKELKEKLVELSDALKKRNPNSVAALIQAAGPPEELVNERDALKSSVKLLKQEIESQKNDYEKRLRRFRQDHERIKAGLEKQLGSDGATDGAADATNASGGDSAATTPSKKDDSTFRWYQKKIMDMEKKCEARVRAAKRGTLDSDSAGPSSSNAAALTKERNYSKRLQKEKDELSSQVDALRTEVEGLKSNLEKSRKDAAAKPRDAAPAAAAPPAPVQPAPESAAKLEALQTELRAFQSKVLLAEGKSSRLAAEKKSLAEQLQQLNMLLMTTQSSGGADQSSGPDREAMEQANTLATEQIKMLQSKLSSAHVEIEALSSAMRRQAAGIPAALQSLTRKVSNMEQRRREREVELQGVVNDLGQRHHSEMASLRRKMEDKLVGKDAQIVKFKMELDILLRAVRQVKLRSSQDMAGGLKSRAEDPGEVVAVDEEEGGAPLG
jgi:hypothetical protein